MMKRNPGFTLVELLITMVILGMALAAISDTFVGLLNQYKLQSKISETNIEGVIGLELLRQDIEMAGYGLPWYLNGISYTESPLSSAEAAYIDSPGAAPRAIQSGNNAGINFSYSGTDKSDVLVIKATNIPRNDSSQRWTSATNTPPDPPQFRKWNDPTMDPQQGDYVIVLSPGKDDNDKRTLVLYSNATGTFWASSLSSSPSTSDFMPLPQDLQPRRVYGIGDSLPIMPFNRADYFIMDRGSSNKVPTRCAPNTGVLVKAVISQSNGLRKDFMPLLDCVADMQVIFRYDATGNNGPPPYAVTDNISTLGSPATAMDIRAKLKEVRVYVLTHEGQKDINYTHNQTSIYVGDPTIGGGRYFDIGPNVNYRWRLYTIAVQLKNLR